MVGIISYGTYIPKYRIKISEIAAAWQKNPDDVVGSLGVVEKSVPAVDEDAATIALAAALVSLQTFPGKPTNLGALMVGSESHPYAVNPTSTIVGELLGIGHEYLAVDLEFACKAATAGVQAVAGLVKSGQISAGMVIGADTAQGKPHDFLEYTAAAAGVSLILGSKQPVANLLSYTSYSSDTPDFWRRDGIRYPSHAGRFTGEPAYFSHVLAASRQLLSMSGQAPSDFDYCIFHMPNGKFPREAAKRLGFTSAQLMPSLTVDKIGNAYSATALLGLAAVLDVARPGQKIFMVSYGSGAGSDGFIWETTPALNKIQQQRTAHKHTVTHQITDKTYINYVQFLKQTHKL